MVNILYIIGIVLISSATRVRAECAKVAEYGACINKYTLKIAGCSAKVPGTPDLNFYQCQCDHTKEMNECYMLCWDSVEIQQQFTSIISNPTSPCVAVENLKSQGFTMSTSTTKSSTTTGTSTTPVTVPTATNEPTSTNSTTTTTNLGITATISGNNPSATDSPTHGQIPVSNSINNKEWTLSIITIFVVMGVVLV